MKIVKCLECEKYVHKANRCLYCGSFTTENEIELPTIHENVVADYAEVESLVENKKFVEAISLSYSVIEWMPNLAGIFWLRLLAKNECSSVIELIRKGFCCENDSDFCNALLFSTGAEHSAYLEIQKIAMNARKELVEELLNHEYKMKMQTDIFEIKKTMKNEITVRQQNLFELWSELKKIEDDLYNLEMECSLSSKEHRNALDEAVETALKIKEETKLLGECTEEQFYKYQVRIGHVLQQSEQAKEIIENMKEQHPLVKKFKQLVDKREEQTQKIDIELSALKDYESMIERILAKIDAIEEEHKNAIFKVEKYNFQDAAILLGEKCFNEVFHKVGLSDAILL